MVQPKKRLGRHKSGAKRPGARAAEDRHRHADAQLRESEARFRALTELSSDFYWEQDETFRFVRRVGSSWEKEGYPAESAIGKTRWELPALNLTGDDWRRHRADLEAHRSFRNLEIERPLPDGQTRWISTSGEPIFDPEGRFRGYRGIGRDITAQKLAEKKLKESEERFKTLVERSADAIVLVDANGALLYRSPSSERLFGYSEEQAIGRRFSDFVHEDDLPRVAAAFSKIAQAPGESTSLECRYRHGDGAWHHLEATVTNCLHDPSVRAIVANVRDVTERARAQEEQRRFRIALDSTLDSIYLVDHSTMRFVDVNRAACERLGYSREELLRLGPQDVLKAGRVRIQRVYDAVIAAGERGHVSEERFVRSDGSEGWSMLHRHAVRHAGGWLIVTLGRDITERKRAEEAIGRSEAKFRLLFDSLPAGVVIQDSRGKVMQANPAACAILGLSADQMMGRTAYDARWRLVKEDGTPRLPSEMPSEVVLRSGQAVTDFVTGIFIPEKEEYRWILINSVPIKAGGRQTIETVTTFLDITDSHRAAEALRAREAELRLITDSVPALIAYHDAHYRYGFANLAYREFYTGSQASIVGKTLEDVLGPEIASLARVEIGRALAGEPRQYGRRMRRQVDGSRRDMDITLVPHRDSAGQVVGVYALALDLTRRRRAERALQEREAQLSLVVDNVPAMICYFDSSYKYRYANRAYTEFYTKGEPVEGKTLSEMLGPEVWQAARLNIDRALAGESAHYTRRHVQSDGTAREIEVSMIPDRDSGGRVVGVHTMILDVTERRRADEALRLRNRVVEASLNSVIVVELRGTGREVVYVNPAFERITGYLAAEVMGKDLLFLHGEDRDQPGLDVLRRTIAARGEATVLLRNYRKDGSLFWNELRVCPITDEAGHATHMLAVGNDVTERVRYEEEIERSANFDSLTGLPNRNLMNDRLAQAILQAGRARRTLAVLFVDLDNLKRINDSLGHAMGDTVIMATGKRLAEALRTGDTVARLGGDEFVVILPDLKHEEDAASVAAKVLNFVGTPLNLEGREFVLTASIGVALWPKDGPDAPTLIRHADTALYRAKEEGRNCFRFFAPEMNDRVVQFVALEENLRRALQDREFELHYQPIVPIEGGAPVGAEALLRWRRPDGSMISPAQFIPVAEESGLIVPIGRWVMEQAMAQAAEWNRARSEPLYVSINLSMRQFRDPDLVEVVRSSLAKAAVRPNLIAFEITESAVMHNVEEAVRLLQALKGVGVRLSVDDFGTGYSSLAYLKRFPIDLLKVDRAFVRDVATDRGDQALSRAIIALGRSLGIAVIAEGVETLEQVRYLSENGCTLAQGFLYGRPVRPADFALAGPNPR